MIRIIIGFLLLFSTSKELVAVARDHGTFLEPVGIFISLLLIFVCAWLIGTGFSKRKLKIKSFDFVKFFIISFVSFMFFLLINISSYKAPKEYVEFNGIKISVGEFIDGSRRVIPDIDERRKYCLCIVEKLANSSEIKKKYKNELENGKIGKLLLKIQKEDYFEDLKIDDCLKSVAFKWTDRFAEGMKKKCMQELLGTEFEKTNNIENYCDCWVEEYRKLTLDKISIEDFNDSLKAVSIDSICNEKSKK